MHRTQPTNRAVCEPLGQVVCGRGGSATTRYVDLVVGLEADDGDGGAVTVTQQEFSNIDRDALPSLQVPLKVSFFSKGHLRCTVLVTWCQELTYPAAIVVCL